MVHWSFASFCCPNEPFLLYLRVKRMAAVPTICPLHHVPMEDSCNACSAWGLPISVRTSRGSRFVCADCKRPLASPQISGKTTPSPESIALLEFEATFGEALKNQRNLLFHGASIGPKYFLQTVEDLFWLLTRRAEGNAQLFVHHLHRTVFRISQRLDYLPQSRPRPGDFDARTGSGCFLTLPLSPGADRFASGSSYPLLGRTPASQRTILIRAKSLYKSKINSEWKCHHSTNYANTTALVRWPSSRWPKCCSLDLRN
jgi:hypothetical protein